MGKKLLVLTDFSKSSWNAIQYAVRLYEHRPCDLYILNTYRKESHGFDSITLLPEEVINKQSENRSKKGLGDILERVSEIDRNIRHHFYMISRPGPLLDAVKDLVVNQEIDMIFMGNRGVDNIQKNRYGKNTLEIIQNIRNCPVMVVPEIATPGPPKEIVLATNFHTKFDFQEMDHLAEMARLTRAKVRVLSLADRGALDPHQKKNKLSLRRHFEGVDFSVYTVGNLKMEEAFNTLGEGSGNMISYIDKKPSLLERLGFGRSMLERLGHFKDMPVLALHG